MINDKGICPQCAKPAISLFYADGDFVCRHCLGGPDVTGCRLFEFGHENPMDPKGSTAHVRDIKARRWDPKNKQMFYYEKPKTYFFTK